MRHHAPIRVRFICLYVLALTAASVAPAFAHAALSSSTPKDGARLGASPETVVVSYAEPPTNNSVFTVTDGCGDDVTGEVEILNNEIAASVNEGQPGRWAIDWRVISAVDGHPTNEGIRFRVAGEADCSQAAPETDDTRAPEPATSIPLVPIAAATAVILAVAVAIRLRSHTDTNND